MEYVLGNVFIRPMVLDQAGQVVHGHDHNFSHVTYICHGAARFELLDRADVFVPDPTDVRKGTWTLGSVLKTVDKRASQKHNFVMIAAGQFHRITALEDGTIGHCIYSHRNPQCDVVAEYDGWTPAYV